MPEGIEYYIQRNEYLEKENASLKERILAYEKDYALFENKYALLDAKNNYIQAQLDQLKRMIFGAKSERFMPEAIPGQMMLELGADPTLQIIEGHPTPVGSYSRGGQKASLENKPVRSLLPADLPRQEIIIEPRQDISDCKKIGEEITETLELELPKLVVLRYVRPKYVKSDGSTILIGELPSVPIQKGMAGPKLLAHVVISKFVDHLPVYRQVKQFSRWGIELPDSTVYGWITGTCKLLEPLYECLKNRSLSSNYLQADESPLQVLTKEKKGKTHRGYMWVYHSPPKKMVLFDYRPGRNKEGPEELLKNYQGFLQTDGYQVYDDFANTPGITLVGCMAHARRYFEQALKNDRQTAEYMMQRFGSLYDLEREMRKSVISAEEIAVRRTEEAVPVLEEMKLFMKSSITRVTPQSPIGKAIGYALPRWEKLCLYTQHGELNIDNNLVENQIRPMAIGRKNYLFAGSHESAQRSAMLYSFMGTCKLNGVDPEKWLTDVLRKIPETKLPDLHTLLPNNYAQPAPLQNS